jgi:hypothetical protein
VQNRLTSVVGWIIVATMLSLCAGCGDGGRERVKVSGTVKYADGTVPQGEVCVIRFEPASMATGKADATTKAASGAIQPDGSYQMTTVEPNDGVFPGEYKVTFTVKAKYDGASPNLVEPKFATAATTPHSATVKSGDNKPLDFVIEKAK